MLGGAARFYAGFVVWWLLLLGACGTLGAASIGYRQFLYWHSEQIDLVVIDLRQPYQYNRGHIPGARNLPYSLIDYPKIRAYRGKVVVLYSHSAELTRQAEGLFEQRVYTLSDGYLGWLRLGYPIAKPNPKLRPKSGRPGTTGAGAYQDYLVDSIDSIARAEEDKYYSLGRIGGSRPGPDGPNPPRHYKNPINYRAKGNRRGYSRAYLRRKADEVGTRSRDIRKRNRR
ncbi:rhodanese-like domain-containing protein [Candidatus Haliotispira prima]|uniref:Rhodanese-like domain-containing protein n=1 Tax=Candidatus Haliotispira prima TaxID=3034016 RepID=A0ABY8ME52_9SPIO|nr:rhodanese-like domain-containing protein [Candidatus Haliotispira prima]